MREALLADPSPTAVLRYSELAPYDAEVVEVCLAALGDRAHPAKPLLKGRLASPVAAAEAGPGSPACSGATRLRPSTEVAMWRAFASRRGSLVSGAPRCSLTQ